MLYFIHKQLMPNDSPDRNMTDHNIDLAHLSTDQVESIADMFEETELPFADDDDHDLQRQFEAAMAGAPPAEIVSADPYPNQPEEHSSRDDDTLTLKQRQAQAVE